jgi:hypothetical protein
MFLRTQFPQCWRPFAQFWAIRFRYERRRSVYEATDARRKRAAPRLALTLVSSAQCVCAVYVCVALSYLWRLPDFLQTENKKRRAVALNKYYVWCGAYSVCIKARGGVFPFYPPNEQTREKERTAAAPAYI